MRKTLQKQCVSHNILATTREEHFIPLNIFALPAKQLFSMYNMVEFILHILLPDIYSVNDWGNRLLESKVLQL